MASHPGPDDLVVTYLPLCHIAERIFSTWHLVGAGVVLNFAESIDTVTANLREVQPTLFFAVPRIWEKLHAGVLIKGNDASRFKRMMLNRGLRAAGKIGRAKVANGGSHTTSQSAALRSRGIRWCSARSRSASVCAAAATPGPAPPRSPPRCWSSSWASASPCSSSTG